VALEDHAQIVDDDAEIVDLPADIVPDQRFESRRNRR
jgi:hypothetical protein